MARAFLPVLAIETSCDETAAAMMDEGFCLRSNVVHSQVEDHAPFGGVMPETASRRHLEMIGPVVRRAIEDANCEPRSVAVTVGPGLIGSLVVGVSFADAFALGRAIPAFAIHHHAGHLAAVLIEQPDWRPPFLALVVSGGHTELIEVTTFGKSRRLARTLDDAAGEAFDKAAKLLGLGYPGGPAIATAAAEETTGERIKLAGALMAGSPDFSFSGLKTALRNAMRRVDPLDETTRRILAASFQDEVVANLVSKTGQSVERTRATRLVVTGGVAANRRLRSAMTAMADRFGIELAIPSPEYCTDNAAMIAAALLSDPNPRFLNDVAPSAILSLS